jgi:hypothetical protein
MTPIRLLGAFIRQSENKKNDLEMKVCTQISLHTYMLEIDAGSYPEATISQGGWGERGGMGGMGEWMEGDERGVLGPGGGATETTRQSNLAAFRRSCFTRPWLPGCETERK